jgi:peptide chain release factor 1
MVKPIQQRDERNAVIEIVPGIGGREAQLWADDVREMLAGYAERMAFQVEDFGHIHGSGHLIIKGRGAYSVFRYEAGIHEVQRVPTTDHHGRIHSSTATVIVLPEINENELGIQQSDLQMETFQGVDSLHSGVLVTHIPSGVHVSAQSSQYELDNIKNAIRLLRARLYNLDQTKRKRGFRLIRKQQLASGQRAERIRTYNYKEGRVRDHRTGVKSMQLKQIMEGRLEQFTVAMRDKEQAKQQQQQAPVA